MQDKFLIVNFTSDILCPECKTPVAVSRHGSYVVDSEGRPVHARLHYDLPMRFAVRCDNGHLVRFSTYDTPYLSGISEAPSKTLIERAVTLEAPLA